MDLLRILDFLSKYLIHKIPSWPKNTQSFHFLWLFSNIQRVFEWIRILLVSEELKTWMLKTMPKTKFQENRNAIQSFWSEIQRFRSSPAPHFNSEPGNLSPFPLCYSSTRNPLGIIRNHHLFSFFLIWRIDFLHLNHPSFHVHSPIQFQTNLISFALFLLRKEVSRRWVHKVLDDELPEAPFDQLASPDQENPK